MLRVYGFVFCSIPLLFVYLHMCMSSNPVIFDQSRAVIMAKSAYGVVTSPYQPEAFGLSCPGWVLFLAGYQKALAYMWRIHMETGPRSRGRRSDQESRRCFVLLTLSDVIGLLAMWRHNKPKTKNPEGEKRGLQFTSLSFFLSWVWKTQPDHWTKRMVSTRLAT